MYSRSVYSLMMLPIIIVLITLFTPSCGDLYQRVDVYIVNCTEDNLRIESLTTNLHLERDCMKWTDAVGYGSTSYFTSLDANISTKAFTFTRSIWNYKHNLIISVNPEQVKEATKDLGEYGDVPPYVVITLYETTDPDTGNPAFSRELNGDVALVGFTGTIEHNYN